LKDWPSQLGYLYQLTDEHKSLAAFKAELVKRYGMPSSDVNQDDDESDED
jgi:hypothetical protein